MLSNPLGTRLKQYLIALIGNRLGARLMRINRSSSTWAMTRDCLNNVAEQFIRSISSPRKYSFSDLKEKYYVLADINKPWHEVFYFSTSRKSSGKKPNGLFRDDSDFNNYLKICWDNDPTLSKADIIVSTIHGIKGMERKKVVICNDWGFSLRNYYSGLIEKEEEELITCYVGVKRAQEELYILNTGRQKNKFPYLIL